MLKVLVIPVLLTLATICADSASALPNACVRKSGVTLQVLGSGGPIADDARAGTSYLIWVDGRSRILIDAGGGTFVRFAESGARFQDLDLIGLSHFHVDHTADFAALLKSGSFSERSRALIVGGPDGSDKFPGLHAFMERLIGPNEGLYAYLGGYLNGRGRLPKLALLEVHEMNAHPVVMLGDVDSDYQVTALRISHGIVPALAYRVQVGDTVIVFLGDQDGTNRHLSKFAADADILVVHMPIPESAGKAARKLHARPSSLGQLASDARAQSVVVSHLMRRSLASVDANLETIRSRYTGPVTVANDHDCFGADRE